MSADDNDDSSDPKNQRNYEVGYGKPPKRTQFQPGRSGNPKGKQKGQRSDKETVQAAFNEKIKIQTSAGSKRMAKFAALVHLRLNKALNGNDKASEQVFRLAREYGLKDEVADAMNLATMNALSEDDQAILAHYRDKNHG